MLKVSFDRDGTLVDKRIQRFTTASLFVLAIPGADLRDISGVRFVISNVDAGMVLGELTMRPDTFLFVSRPTRVST